MSQSQTAAGRALIAEWHEIQTREVAWILQLVEFDRDELWRVDGFHSCAAWLEIMCEIGRSTAYEYVRVTHELARRETLQAAFVAGQLPYSKARELTRLEGVDEARDATFLADAADMSLRALAMRVRNWNYFNGRDRRPGDDHYGMHRERGFMDGLGRLVIEAPNDMLDRIDAIIDAYDQFLFHNGDSTLRLPSASVSTRETYPQSEDPFAEDANGERVPARPHGARRLDLLLDLFEEVALVNEDKLDPEIAAVGVTVRYEDLITNRRTLVTTDQGSILTGEAVYRLACDAGIVRMIMRGVSEFLDIGRKTRVWTTAQRRAISARHGHRCAAQGCGRRIFQIHHIVWWENGGVTSIDNGVPLCSYHHHLVHEGGWTVTYNATTGVTRLEGPLGQILETTASFLRAA